MRLPPLVLFVASATGHLLPPLEQRQADDGIFYTTVTQTAFTTEIERTTIIQTAYLFTDGFPREGDNGEYSHVPVLSDIEADEITSTITSTVRCSEDETIPTYTGGEAPDLTTAEVEPYQ